MGSSKGTKYLIANHISYRRFSGNHVKYLNKISSYIEPSTYKEASTNTSRLQAIGKELQALEDTQDLDSCS